MSNSTEHPAKLCQSEIASAADPAQNQLQIFAIPPSNEERNANQFDHRFQRTDQWMPVYAWLESLDTDEVVKSKDILDWLTNNPEIREQLYSRHSRYHLMHYIKKCHVKILKRKDKNKGVQATSKVQSETITKNGETRAPVPVQCMGNYTCLIQVLLALDLWSFSLVLYFLHHSHRHQRLVNYSLDDG